MSKELVINSDSQTTRIAIVEGGDLAELFIETEEHERTIGNLFLGRVRRIMPSIQAAFVDIGQKQDAFLHFSDLTEALPDWLEYIRQEKPQIAGFNPEHVQKSRGGKRRRPVSGHRRKRLEDGAEDPEAELAEEQSAGDGGHRRVVGQRNRGRRKAGQRHARDTKKRGGHGHSASEGDEDGVPPETFLERDQPILVKISKEPIAQKGSRVTTDISLAGRFLVLVPMANYVAVSKKISSFKERRRLRALAKMLLPDGFGVIVRTVAEGQNAKALDTDLRLLKEKWAAIERRLAERPKPPAAVYQDVNMVSSIMRDLFSEDFDRILVDDNRMYRNLKGYVQAIAPEMGAKVSLHQSRSPVFKSVGIHRAAAEAFESRVNLPSGGYLFIEQTEAMHVIDVNSGRAGKGLSQEENSLKVNIEAAKVVARQIRLRDLGGILVIDFIDMRSDRNRRKVFDQLRREFRKDRAVTKVLPMSDFGLMQITRQRLRPSITTTFSELQDEVVGPAGEEIEVRREPRERPWSVEPEELVGRVEDWLGAFRAARWKGAIRLRVHPFVAAFLSRGLVGFGTKCLLKYRIRLRIEENPGMDPSRFRFYDETNGKEIRRPPRRGRKKVAAKRPEPSEAAQENEAHAQKAESTTKPLGSRTTRGRPERDTASAPTTTPTTGRRSLGGARESTAKGPKNGRTGSRTTPRSRGSADQKMEHNAPKAAKQKSSAAPRKASSDSAPDKKSTRSKPAGKAQPPGEGRKTTAKPRGGRKMKAEELDAAPSAAGAVVGVQVEQADKKTRKAAAKSKELADQASKATEGPDQVPESQEPAGEVATEVTEAVQPVEESAEQIEEKSGEAVDSASSPSQDTVHGKSRTIQPHRLRYSSSHRREPEPSNSDQA